MRSSVADALRLGSAVGLVLGGGMMGERDIFERACWKIVVLQNPGS